MSKLGFKIKLDVELRSTNFKKIKSVTKTTTSLRFISLYDKTNKFEGIYKVLFIIILHVSMCTNYQNLHEVLGVGGSTSMKLSQSVGRFASQVVLPLQVLRDNAA